MILVVSHEGDDHARGVLECLARARHSAVLFDTARYPQEISLTQRFGQGAERRTLASWREEVLDLLDRHVVWWRRPQPLVLHPQMRSAAARFAYMECHEALAGLWANLSARWVNPPAADEEAHHKPYQLAVASSLGLRIPKTLITNDPKEARAFAEELGPEQVVYKTFLATEEAWRETRLLRESELELLQHVRHAPVIFQEFIAARADLRVTIVGERLFASEVRLPFGAYPVDYRMSLEEAVFSPTRLPSGIEGQLRALMERLGLIYGAIDLRQTHGGEYVFLEINPAGEWMFVEERTGQPMTAGMATLLMELDTKQ